MKTISLQITDKEFNLFGLTKEQMLFSEFKEFIEKQIVKETNYNEINIISDITLASEKSLSNDWLLPDEDLVWQDL